MRQLPLRRYAILVGCIAVALLTARVSVWALQSVPQSPPGNPLANAEQPVDSGDSGVDNFAPEEIDGLTAPIALYPDALIAQILPASTFPVQVVQAARFVADGNDSAKADSQDWDDSVKALCRFPSVLKMLNDKLDWTTELGQAYLQQPQDVMDSIQQLRVEAKASGNLDNTPQQNVVQDQETIQIVPADPQVIYVPVYDPQVVYVRRAPDYVGPIFTWGAGIRYGTWLDKDCDWHGRHVYWRPGIPRYGGGVWSRPVWDRPGWQRPPLWRPAPGRSRPPGYLPGRSSGRPPVVRRPVAVEPRRPVVEPRRPVVVTPPRNVGGDYRRGSDIRNESDRGRASREAARPAPARPAPAPAHPAPAPARPAPARTPSRGGAEYKGGNEARAESQRGAASRGHR